MNRNIILHRMGRSKLFMTGFFGVMVVIILTLIAPLIIVHDPYTSSLTMRLSPPEWFSNGWSGYVLGTDAVGRDILTRLLIGARYSLFVALVVSCSACLIGVTVGMISGYCGGIVDMVLMRVCDIVNSIPDLLLAIVVVTIFGTGLKNLVIILICTSWVSFARLTRNNVMVIRNKVFVLAARSLGAKNMFIMFKEILANVTTPLLIQFSQMIGKVIRLEASLSFLDLGVPPPAPSWGGMISTGRSHIQVAPWTVVFPGICLMWTLMSFNFLGDGLRDVLDPKRT